MTKPNPNQKKSINVFFKPLSASTQAKIQKIDDAPVEKPPPPPDPLRLPHRLSPRLNFGDEHKQFTKTFTEEQREFEVDVKWDIDNSSIQKEVGDCTESEWLYRNVEASLQTLRKGYKIRSFVGYGDIHTRFSDKQIIVLQSSRIKLVNIPMQNRLSDAAKKNQQDLLSAQQFISLNPYIFGPYDPYYPDAFLSDSSQIQSAKYFLAKYFGILDPRAWGQNASVPSSSGSVQNQGFKQKTDLGDIVIIHDLLIEALDNGPPGNILLISGDVDFAKPLQSLRERGFTILLAENGLANSSLIESTSASWLWSVMRKRGKFNRFEWESNDKFFTD